jgi:hypothetical protein
VKSWFVCADEFLGRIIMSMGDFTPFRDKNNLNFLWKGGVCDVDFVSFSVSIFYIGKHPVLSPTCGGRLCHAINKWKDF